MTKEQAGALVSILNGPFELQIPGEFVHDFEINETEFTTGMDFSVAIRESNTSLPEEERPPMFMHPEPFIDIARAFGHAVFLTVCDECFMPFMVIH